ncbi:LIC_10190 family membrane protein [Longitalea luteola]|uniref:LIC_10190 family membrane protein n=1 Tax=Longitalea luteola TaxID=2812563 RepID=UPI001A9678A4|nr:hypothetical protein [Longitalea luteola]
MLLTLLSWIYITAVCLIWGNILLSPFKQLTATGDAPDLPVICLTGLAGIGVLSLAASVLIPLALAAHLIVLVFAIAYILIPTNRKQIIQQLIFIRRMKRLPLLLFSSCALLILVMSTYEIIHPDTLLYHAQAIKVMEQYKAIPGLVHLRYETAMASMWFAVQAIFRFDFIHTNNYLFVNGCVLCWFCLLLCLKLTTADNKQSDAKAITNCQLTPWVLLLIYSTVSWTQLRLTAVSASPDFITSLYIWAAFYSFAQTRSGNNRVYTYLTVLFCCTALTIKLSAIAIALLPLLIVLTLLRQKKIKTALLLTGVSAVIIMPYLVRNTITTGYPLFPSTVVDLFNFDWKLSEPQVQGFQHYIKAYARFPVAGYNEAEQALQLPVSKWLPMWWNQLALPDQLLLCSILALSMHYLIAIRTNIQQQGYTGVVILAVALTGSLVWMIAAPATRFGTGFLIPLCYSVGAGLQNSTLLKKLFKERRVGNVMIIPVILLMVFYIGYRLVYYFKPSQIILPIGVKEPVYKTVNCHKIKFSISDNCGFAPSPCVGGSCEHIIFRGTSISDGFKGK